MKHQDQVLCSLVLELEDQPLPLQAEYATRVWRQPCWYAILGHYPG